MTFLLCEFKKWKRNRLSLSILVLFLVYIFISLDYAFNNEKTSFMSLFEAVYKDFSGGVFTIFSGILIGSVFFIEEKNETLKSIFPIPFSKTQFYFGKMVFLTVILVALCILVFFTVIISSIIKGGYSDFQFSTVLTTFLTMLSLGILSTIALGPICLLTVALKGYVISIVGTVFYTVFAPSFFLHPIASQQIIIQSILNRSFNKTTLICLISMTIIFLISSFISIRILKTRNH